MRSSKAWIFLSAIFILSLFDALATAYGVNSGFYEEANPLMVTALEHSIPTFIIVKVLLLSLCCTILYKFWSNKLARLGTYVLIILYTAICTGHIIAYTMLNTAGIL